MRTPFRPTLRLPARRGDRCLVLRPADDRLSHGRSRPTDEVGQVVLHSSLGDDSAAPAARTSVLGVLSQARYRQGAENLRSRRAASRRRQQILARSVPSAATTPRSGSLRCTVSAPTLALMACLWTHA